jgi:hypothetical protein
MSEISDLREKEIKEVGRGKYSIKIEEMFNDLNIPLSEKTERTTHDLGEIYEICGLYMKYVDLMLSNRAQNNTKFLIEILNEIDRDFYIHLIYHLKELMIPLEILIDELEAKEGMIKSKELKPLKQEALRRLNLLERFWRIDEEDD